MTTSQSPTASGSSASSSAAPPETSVLARLADKRRASHKPITEQLGTAAPAATESRSGHGVEESFRFDPMNKEVCDCGRKMKPVRGADNVALRLCEECDHCAPGDESDFAA